MTGSEPPATADAGAPADATDSARSPVHDSPAPSEPQAAPDPPPSEPPAPPVAIPAQGAESPAPQPTRPPPAPPRPPLSPLPSGSAAARDRPGIAVGAAFAAGFVFALILRRLAC
jgi:hypothetical protein